MPFVFQTAHGRDFSQSRFMAFVHWQDALMEMLKIDFHGGITDNGMFTPVTQIYELQTGDFDLSAADSVYRGVERVCYLIFDWEILESYYLDERSVPRLSSAQIAHVAAGFPAWVYSRLLSMRYIRQEDCLHVIVKKKSRKVSGDFKHSYHFIFEIAGIPVLHHKHVCAELVRPYIHDKVRVKQAKTLAFLSDDQLQCPVWGLDLVNHGNQAFATLLSRKSGSDPYPTLRRRIVFNNGVIQRVEAFPAWPRPGEDVQLQLDLLRSASYTIPKTTGISYTSQVTRSQLITQPSSRRSEAPRDRTADPSQPSKGKRDRGAPTAASRGGDPPFDGAGRLRTTTLPDWLESVLTANGGYRMNTSMSCLATQKGRLMSLREGLELEVVHVTHMFCPVLMSHNPPVVRIHSNNGCMIAWDAGEDAEEAVYARCPYCRVGASNDTLPGDIARSAEKIQNVGGGWFRLTKRYLHGVKHTGMCCVYYVYLF